MAYQVVICDDEHYIAQTTAMMLKTQDGLELDVHVFTSPGDASARLRRAKVDLLIADIQMPGVSGLALMREAAALWPMCQVILLTAHSEFEYVYEAIQHEHVTYVLKSAGHEALLGAVYKAVQNLAKSLHHEALLSQARQQVEDTLPYLRRELIMDLVHGVPYTAEAIHTAASRLRLSIDMARPMAMALLLMKPTPQDIPFWERSERWGYVFSLLNRYASPRAEIWPVQVDAYRAVCLVQGKAPTPATWHLEGLLESAQHAAEGAGLCFSAVFSQNVQSWLDLRRRYEQMQYVQASMAAGDADMWLLSLEREPLEPTPLRMDSAYASKARLWRHMFENGDPGADGMFNALLAPMHAFASIQNAQFMEMYTTLALQVVLILRGGSIDPPASDISIQLLLSAQAHGTPETAAAYLGQTVGRIRRARQAITSDSAQRIVDRVVRYIKAHLSDDISLTQLAEHAGVNTSYLSRVFRRLTGSTLVQYIAAEKMHQAYTLLKDKDTRMQEISRSLGFYSPTYFSYFFKKHAGISPSEWRERQME